ncbi:hypothetical protein IF1G_08773 [Cordyceps javanica]|uniref:Uncharacterized protein n=1 Tax=Cordyceps javanica TaxID=43265 RepID=A0A545UTP8_9HYPO|nr:hypothetical protein IF1G_08773 [Cordyceps javanica]
MRHLASEMTKMKASFLLWNDAGVIFARTRTCTSSQLHTEEAGRLRYPLTYRGGFSRSRQIHGSRFVQWGCGKCKKNQRYNEDRHFCVPMASQPYQNAPRRALEGSGPPHYAALWTYTRGSNVLPSQLAAASVNNEDLSMHHFVTDKQPAMQETTPLLLGDETQRQRPPIAGSFWQARGARSICLLVALFSFMLAVAGAVSEVPTTRLVEDHICRSYYDEQQQQQKRINAPPTEIDETMCKVDEVQSRLVFLNGWISMIQGTLGMLHTQARARRRDEQLLVAFPYGIYADRFVIRLGSSEKVSRLTIDSNGRKPVLRLSLVGVILQAVYGWAVLAMGQTMPINLLLASPLFVLVGGGSTVLVSTMYSIISDVADEANRYAPLPGPSATEMYLVLFSLSLHFRFLFSRIWY